MDIERGIPIPPARNNQNITATLRRLKKGDSVFIPGKKAVEMSGFVNNAGMTGKLTMRSIDGGCRIWRIK